ncbi:MAG: FecR domain-containing protein [Planctomycetota bacterium]|nr:FecR domain-containing protein [Planctomycetota bacterium]
MKRTALLLAAFLLLFSYAYGEPDDRASLNSGSEEAKEESSEKPTKKVSNLKIGFVKKLKGKPEVTRDEKTFALTLKSNLYEMDEISVPEGGLVVIELLNVPGKEGDTDHATELTLYENSEMRIEKRSEDEDGDIVTRIKMDKGKLNSDVKDGRRPKWMRRRDKARDIKRKERGKSDYEIETPTATAGVRGTEFVVAVTPSKTFVFVKSGTVWVKDRVKKEIREVKRRRLLEVGADGFGREFKADSGITDTFNSPEFSPNSFDPTAKSTKPDPNDGPPEDPTKEPDPTREPDPGDAVERDITDKVEDPTNTPPDKLEPGPGVTPGEPVEPDLPDPPIPPAQPE